MAEKFQFAVADGTPDWTPGQVAFDPVWDHGYDRLRFHRGKGFTVGKVGDKTPTKMKLGAIHDFLKPKLTGLPDDTKFLVRSLRDNYGLVWRKHSVVDPGGLQVIAVEKSLIGVSYVWGVTDCSWLTKHAVGEVEPSIDLAHNATMQMHDSRVVHISKAKLKMGDLLFHWGDTSDVDHVSTFYDFNGPAGNGRVIDTEPHDTGSPPGWPKSRLGTGVQIRPMNDGYYCDWAHVVA